MKRNSSTLISSRTPNQQEFHLIKELGSSKAQVFLVYFPKTKKFRALKVYPHDGSRISTLYLNEARFCSLSHPNIISFSQAVDRCEAIQANRQVTFSYISMEVARYGDFSFLINNTTFSKDEKMVRTYFHQLIQGIEYLHSQGISHLDLKPDNLLLGEDMNLKITDFDSAYKEKDRVAYGKGTNNYRSPEIIKADFSNPQMSDIYSIGIILFVMRTGFFPYLEDTLVEGYDLENLMKTNPSEFWKTHDALHGSDSYISPGFQELFINMVKEKPSERWNLNQIKKSEWFRGPVYSPRELKAKLTPFLAKVDILKKLQS